MKYSILIVSFLLFAAFSLSADDATGNSKSYGKALALEDTVAVSKLLMNPEPYSWKNCTDKRPNCWRLQEPWLLDLHCWEK